MKPCYIDLHIHTSKNPNSLNNNYDLESLIIGIKKIAKENEFLISLTDHNTINKNAYKKLISSRINFLIGVELTVRNYDGCTPYHCHIYFKVDNDKTEASIDKLNKILDELYPVKNPENSDISIPHIQQILDKLDDYEYLVLPHGGQSHSTFDKSIPHDNTIKFNTVMYKAIYYNIFDGFTSRSNKGLEKTNKYFEELGIDKFTNLITSTDNYDPSKYPKSLNDNVDFIPTWMYSTPNFDGLRVSLTESSRLTYGNEPKIIKNPSIGAVTLDNDCIKIDAYLANGLNVVIGNASSGKTLFVDSIYNKIVTSQNKDYLRFHVDQIKVNNPTNITPHYFSQNYILTNILKKEDNGVLDLSSVTLLNKIFKLDKETTEKINNTISSLERNLDKLITSANELYNLREKILNQSNPAHLLLSGKGKYLNVYACLMPTKNEVNKLSFTETSFENYNKNLDELLLTLKLNPFYEPFDKEINLIKQKIKTVFEKTLIENEFRKRIGILAENDLKSNKSISEADQRIIASKTCLLECLSSFKTNMDTFYSTLEAISKFNVTITSQEIKCGGHILFLENAFSISQEAILSIFNKCLKNPFVTFNDINPEQIIPSNFSKKAPKINNFDDLKKKILDEFISLNKTNYKILYKGKTDFNSLSPGLKSSVILDIILTYDNDNAPIIIDQPEDNLSTEYLNADLISHIKESKSKRQIIIVTHNATIPMLADAQNVIICEHVDNKIVINSAPLEGNYNGKTVTDWIAELTDGGKASIKKRFKKYNIRYYKENNDETNTK